MAKNDIHEAVYEGIRKTIRRFRERPFLYFTEADVHASCVRDMMVGASNIFEIRPVDHVSVSLVHQEYPTNFRYEKQKLLEGYEDESITNVDSTDGDRGNFDLAVLNPDFVKSMFDQYYCKSEQKNTEHALEDTLKHIINKDVTGAVQRRNMAEQHAQELLYAVEFKFIHLFNARSINLLKEIIKDTEKLRLARHHSGGNLRVLNLVFCATRAMERRRKGYEKMPVVNRIKKYCAGEKVEIEGKGFKTPPNVFTAFIPSFLGKDGLKHTEKPTCGYEGSDMVLTHWAENKKLT